jgi:hypothetical protein
VSFLRGVYLHLVERTESRSRPALPANVHLPSHSSSSSTKRNLKPSPIAANTQHNSHYPATTELPSLQPAAPITTAGQESHAGVQAPPASTANRKRKSVSLNQPPENSTGGAEAQASSAAPQTAEVDAAAQEPKAKKSRTNTPWTPAEELRLKQMRDAQNSWSEIAKVHAHQSSSLGFCDRGR